MIRYRLVCANPRKRTCKNEFESWFQDSAAFDKLAKAGAVSCPKCGGTQVEKALMAPSVKTTKGKEKTARKPAVPNRAPAQAQALAALTPEQRAFVEMARKIREHVVQNSEYVGDRFVDEARKIHYEEAGARGIYGEASLEDAVALAEEGIDVLPIPEVPEDRN
jgi:hypothetical protein